MMNLEEIEEELVEIPLTEHEWDMVAWLIAEVKRLRGENAELRKQLELEHDQRDRLPINIILDAPPFHDSGRFVEVETDDGKSIRVGEWIEKDGYWALRITELPKASAQKIDSEWEIEFIR